MFKLGEGAAEGKPLFNFQHILSERKGEGGAAPLFNLSGFKKTESGGGGDDRSKLDHSSDSGYSDKDSGRRKSAKIEPNAKEGRNSGKTRRVKEDKRQRKAQIEDALQEEGPQWQLQVVQYPIGTRSPAEDLRLIPQFRNSEDGFTVTSIATFSPPADAGIIPGSKLLLTDGDLATHAKLTSARRLLFAVPGPALQKAKTAAAREKQIQKGFTLPGQNEFKSLFSADRVTRDDKLAGIHRKRTDLREIGARLGCLAEKELKYLGFKNKYPSFGAKSPTEKEKQELLLIAAENDSAKTGRLPEHKLPPEERLTPFLKGIRLERVVAIIKGMDITCVSELADRDESEETFAEDLEKLGVRKLEIIRLMKALVKFRETPAWKEWLAMQQPKAPTKAPTPPSPVAAFSFSSGPSPVPTFSFGAFSPPSRVDESRVSVDESPRPAPLFGGQSPFKSFNLSPSRLSRPFQQSPSAGPADAS